MIFVTKKHAINQTLAHAQITKDRRNYDKPYGIHTEQVTGPGALGLPVREMMEVLDTGDCSGARKVVDPTLRDAIGSTALSVDPEITEHAQ